MNTTTAAALAVALGTGIALGVQATTNGHIGTQIGPASTGLLVIVAGGILSAVVFGLFRNRLFAADLGALRGVAAGIVLAGVLAVVAIGRPTRCRKWGSLPGWRRSYWGRCWSP